MVEWDDFARTRLPAARDLDAKALRDDARELLLNIAADMRDAQTDAQRDDKGRGLDPDNSPTLTHYAKRHADCRLRQGFSLDQMVSEYRALRAYVMRLWSARMDGADRAGALAELIRFDEAMDQALTESVAWYSRQIEESRNLLLGVLGHDLRNPLGAIRSSAIYLLRTEGLDGAQNKAATRILNSAVRMRQMVHDLLDFTATRMGTALPISPTPANMGDICRQVVDELGAFHPDHVLRLEPGAGSLEGRWDVQRIDQLVANLVANAIQHAEPGTPVTVSADAEGDDVRVSVHNAGAPIAEGVRLLLFEPLAHAAVPKDERREGSSGLGLGLYIARQIALAHGGSIEVSSGERDGTTFAVRLPRYAPGRSLRQS